MPVQGGPHYQENETVPTCNYQENETIPRNVPLSPIAGAPPDPLQVVPGCRFHPRCAAATERCGQEVPAPHHHGGHQVACWHPVIERPEHAMVQA